MPIGTTLLQGFVLLAALIAAFFGSSADAQVLTNPGAIIAPSDYPPDAFRRGDEGVTEFRVGVGLDGRAKSCDIVSSAGLPEFDSIVCRNMFARAIFDVSTSPTTPWIRYYRSRVRWVVALGSPRTLPSGVSLVSSHPLRDASKTRCEFSDGEVIFVNSIRSCTNTAATMMQSNNSIDYAEIDRRLNNDNNVNLKLKSSCISYGFVINTPSFSQCLLQLHQIERNAQIQQHQYELQRKQYEQQVAAYEAQQRAIKRERDRQRWETLARWGAGMGQSQSPSFGGALADANAAALGMPPVTKPPAPPPPPVFENFTIRTANGGTVWCTFNAVVREAQCR